MAAAGPSGGSLNWLEAVRINGRVTVQGELRRFPYILFFMYGEIFIYPSHHALAWVQHCRVSWLHALVEVSPLGAWGPGAAQKSAKRCDVAVTVTRTGR